MGHRVYLPCLYYYLSLTLLYFGKLFSMPALSHFPSYLCSLHQNFPYLCYHSSFLPYHLPPPLSHTLVYLFVYFVYSHLQHSQFSPPTALAIVRNSPSPRENLRPSRILVPIYCCPRISYIRCYFYYSDLKYFPYSILHVPYIHCN